MQILINWQTVQQPCWNCEEKIGACNGDKQETRGKERIDDFEPSVIRDCLSLHGLLDFADGGTFFLYISVFELQK